MDSVEIFSSYFELLKKTSAPVNYSHVYEHLRFSIGKVLTGRGMNLIPQASIRACAKSIAIAVCGIDATPTPRNKNTTKVALIDKSITDIISGANVLLNDVADLKSTHAEEFIRSYSDFLFSIINLNEFSHISGHGNGQSDRRVMRFLFLEIYKQFGIKATNAEMLDLLWPIARDKAGDWIYKYLTTEVKIELIAAAEYEEQMNKVSENTQFAYQNSQAPKAGAPQNIGALEGIKQIRSILDNMVDRDTANTIRFAIDSVLLGEDLE